MNEQTKATKETGTRESKDAVPAAAPTFSWKRLLGKKWVFPAVYVAAAAIILTLMWVYQDSAKNAAGDKTALTDTVSDNVSKPDGQSVPVAANAETMQWPVKDRTELEVAIPFYDEKAGTDIKQTAMVEYGDTFTPHLGIDLARQDGKDFEVLAALSGKVTAVEKNPLVGNLVEITHSNGLVTVYQSLGEVKVTKNAEVKKGDVIAKSGRNELEKDHGSHVHFEVRQGADGPAVNPEQYLTAADSTASKK